MDDLRPETQRDDDEPTASEDTVGQGTAAGDTAAPPGPGRLRRAGRRVLAWLLPRAERLTLAIVGGLLLYASFAPLNWWWAAVPAMAALTVVLIRERTTVAGGFGYGYLFGLAFYLPLLPWVGSFVGAVPWLGLAAVCALYPGLFGVMAVLIRVLPGWPVWFAAAWVAQEWVKATVPFGGFPWGIVGFGQTTGPLIPLARFGGVPLVSFAVVLAGAGLAALVVEVVAWWRRDRVRAAEVPPAVVLPGLCIVVVLLATVLAYPQVRRAGAGSGDSPAVTVAAVQGNVPRLGLDFNAQRRAVLDNHVAETERLAQAVRDGRAPQPQFVIWPENSSDIDPLANPDAREQISAAAEAIGAPILVGGVVAGPNWSPDNPTSTNTVIVWDPVTGPGERHDKQIVQPFGEYLPWRGFFSHFSSYAERAGYFVPGVGSGVVHAAGVPIGVTTCWEVIFDRAARNAVRNGAQMLAVPTNNATFDETMSEQLLAFARARAIEHDRYVVVAGTTGISAVIAPDGRELARTAFFEPAYLDAQIRLKTTLTPATQWGPLTQYVLVGVGFLAVLWGFSVAIRHNGGFMRPTRRRRHQPKTDSSGPTTESDAPRGGPTPTTEESHGQ